MQHRGAENTLENTYGKWKCGIEEIQSVQNKDQDRSVSHNTIVIANDTLRHASDRVQRSQGHTGFHHPAYWLWAVQCLRNVKGGGWSRLEEKSMHFGNTVASCALFSVHTSTHSHTKARWRRPVLTFYLKWIALNSAFSWVLWEASALICYVTSL